MKTGSRIRLIILIVLFSFIGSGAEDIPVEPVEINPAEVHQWLWENKLRPFLADKQEAALSLAAQTASNWQEYDAFFYRIELDIDYTVEEIYGRVDMHGTVTVGALDSVKINFSDSLTIDSIYNLSGLLAYTQADDHITVSLDRVYGLDEPFVFTVVYHGTPVQTGGFVGFNFGWREGLPLITTLSEPLGARTWWPCNDITVDKADSVDIIVTVDTELVVSSNGLLESDIDNGDGTHTVYWKERYPIVPYLVSLAIHPYAVWYDWYRPGPTDSMPLHFYVYPDHDDYSRPFFGVLPEMIGLLADVFGEYPFIDEKYGCSHFDWGGAMEHQTNTSTTSTSFGYSDDVIAHELGHQWWGDMVTCGDWHHIWINEGFAVYSEALYHEAKYGQSYYHNYMNQFDYTGSGSIYIQDTTSVWNIFGAIVYDKGGWVLHMLRHVIGDDAFFQSLTEYRSQYQWKSAVTEDFQAVVETVSGMDLDWFFYEWIYGTFRPKYRHSYIFEESPGGGWDIYLHIRQIQLSNPQVFTMPIDIRYFTLAGYETQVVFNDQRVQDFVLHTEYEPEFLDLDPERWISRDAAWEAYTIHILSDSMDDGTQMEDYFDTVTVKSGSGGFTCSLYSGTMPDGWTLDPSTCEISGRPADAGSFTFTIQAIDSVTPSYIDTMQFSVEIETLPPLPGDVNVDAEVNVGDAVYLLNYIFKNGDPPLIPNRGDANADCSINVGDAVYLINYVFKSGNDPVMGCVE